MYYENLFLEYHTSNTSLSSAIDVISNAIDKIKKGDGFNVDKTKAKDMLKTVSTYSTPIKQVYSEQEYRKIIRTLSSLLNNPKLVTESIRRPKKKRRLLFEDEPNNNENKDTSEKTTNEKKDEKKGFLDSVKAYTYKVVNYFYEKNIGNIDKLSNKTDEEGRKIYVSSVEEYLEKFYDKLDKEGFLYKYRKFFNNFMFLIGIGLGLAITNIGVKMAGSNLNEVKSFGDFVRITFSAATKNIIALIFILVGLIIFAYCLYVILRKFILFLLTKIQKFLEKMRDKLSASGAGPAQQSTDSEKK